jgi:GPH family glycoside/pentoside/hexuronide:cation symporter
VTLFWWMLVSMLLYDTCYTMIGLVYSALLPEVSESESERNDLQISSSLFGLLGTLLGFMIPDFFRPKAGGSPSFLPLQVAMVVVAVVAVVLIISTTLKVKERPIFTRLDKPIGVIKAVRLTIINRSFMILVSANFMSILMQSLILGAIFYLADYVLKINTMILLACLFIPLTIGVPITTVIRRRLGVVGAQQFLLVIAGVGLALVAVVPTILIPACIALAGFGLSGPQTLTNLLFAQIADEDELRSGVRREGAFFGVNALFTKPAQSVALSLSPLILQWTHFVTRDQNNGNIFLYQPESALMGIRLFGGLIPGLALLVGALILSWYPLRGGKLKEMQASLLILHAEKQSRLEEAEIS